MAQAMLTISSKNYSSWSLRGWLLCKMAGLEFEETHVDPQDTDMRQELLLLSPTVRVPRLTHGDVQVWDVTAIAGYLNEVFPKAGLYPKERVARAHCRAISGEMHAGFHNLRSALPMNLRAKHDSFKIFSGARPDVGRVVEIWKQCLDTYGGPFLFGTPTMADAMYAPVCTRFRTYSVTLDPQLEAYIDTILAWEPMAEWIKAALEEPEEIEELEVEF